jgi:hypothetical protein
MDSEKLQLVIEFDARDLPTLTEIFKKFKVKTKPARPSADEIEQMIIKKALLDAKAIDRGELKTRPLEELLAELQEKPVADNYKNARTV